MSPGCSERMRVSGAMTTRCLSESAPSREGVNNGSIWMLPCYIPKVVCNEKRDKPANSRCPNNEIRDNDGRHGHRCAQDLYPDPCGRQPRGRRQAPEDHVNGCHTAACRTRGGAWRAAYASLYAIRVTHAGGRNFPPLRHE